MQLVINNFSRVDIERNITLPTVENLNFAEFLGIMVGDGNIYHVKEKGRTTYQIRISGHQRDDIIHHIHINTIFKRLFSIELKQRSLKQNETRLGVDSKAIVTFLLKNGLVAGDKINMKNIPHCVFLHNNRFKSNFLRGLFDTDGCIKFTAKYKSILHTYPIIKISQKNINIIKDVVLLLKEFGFNFYVDYNEKVYTQRKDKEFFRSSIYISGVQNLKKWMKLIGFKNTKHLTKLAIWEEYGFCPPKTTLEQREKIIYGRLDPYSLYNH